MKNMIILVVCAGMCSNGHINKKKGRESRTILLLIPAIFPIRGSQDGNIKFMTGSTLMSKLDVCISGTTAYGVLRTCINNPESVTSYGENCPGERYGIPS